MHGAIGHFMLAARKLIEEKKQQEARELKSEIKPESNEKDRGCFSLNAPEIENKHVTYRKI